MRSLTAVGQTVRDARDAGYSDEAIATRFVLAMRREPFAKPDDVVTTRRVLLELAGETPDALPSWADRLVRSRATSGPGLRALCQMLEHDDDAPDALRELARRVLAGGSFDRVIPSRTSDPSTSKRAEPGRVTARNARGRLLNAYRLAAELGARDGLTDEEAANVATGVSLSSEYAKRCSELREAGYLEPTGEERRGASGQSRMVCRITEAGTAALKVAGISEDGDE